MSNTPGFTPEEAQAIKEAVSPLLEAVIRLLNAKAAAAESDARYQDACTADVVANTARSAAKAAVKKVDETE